ncbi:MAG: DUF2975 domain-containing protein [Clostridiales bacterium]|jgi:hypothetical protein|nr:DUF2975 domain-containing protein [Clostridiales bacterium]
MREKFALFVLCAAALLFAAFGLIVCVFILPTFANGVILFAPKLSFLFYPLLVGLYAAMGCYFYGIYNFWKLMGGYSKNNVLSLDCLRKIRNACMVFCVLYFIFAMPIIFFAAEADDAPGLILFGAFLDLIPMSIAAFSYILEKLTSENPQ